MIRNVGIMSKLIENQKKFIPTIDNQVKQHENNNVQPLQMLSYNHIFLTLVGKKKDIFVKINAAFFC